MKTASYGHPVEWHAVRTQLLRQCHQFNMLGIRVQEVLGLARGPLSMDQMIHADRELNGTLYLASRETLLDICNWLAEEGHIRIGYSRLGPVFSSRY